MTDTTPGPADEAQVNDVLVWTAVRAGRRMERLVAERLASHRLPPMQFGILVYLSVRPGMNQSEIARAIQVRPQSAREAITAMIGRGLLMRDGPEGRGHRSAIRLTDEGRTLLAQTWPVIADIDASDVGLTPDNAAILNRLLHAVLK